MISRRQVIANAISAFDWQSLTCRGRLLQDILSSFSPRTIAAKKRANATPRAGGLILRVEMGADIALLAIGWADRHFGTRMTAELYDAIYFYRIIACERGIGFITYVR